MRLPRLSCGENLVPWHDPKFIRRKTAEFGERVSHGASEKEKAVAPTPRPVVYSERPGECITEQNHIGRPAQGPGDIASGIGKSHPFPGKFLIKVTCDLLLKEQDARTQNMS